MNCKVAAFSEERDCATFTVEGMEGVQRKNPDRPVSLISLQARQEVDQATKRGLCYKKFVADITIDCVQMPPTGALLISNELIMQILPERKRCWPECKLLEEKFPCPLIEGVRYARVEKPGMLCCGEKVKSTTEAVASDQG